MCSCTLYCGVLPIYSTLSLPNPITCNPNTQNAQLRLRLEHFLSVNQTQHASPSSDPLRDAQEIYTLAYAITVCLSAAPTIKCVVGAERAPLPLAPSMDAAGLVRGLFAAAAGAAGEGKGKKGKGAAQEQEEQQKQEEEDDEEEGPGCAGGGGPGKKKRRRKQKKGGGK